jgi:hypothetical protein
MRTVESDTAKGVGLQILNLIFLQTSNTDNYGIVLKRRKGANHEWLCRFQ